ncbi:MAG: hypothetical protein ACI9JN_002261 [Bacteroidia bacterium]|jgi:hypothetical protein
MNIDTNATQKSIWIYVTDIETMHQIDIVSKTLNAEPSILKWSVDTEDIDNVLRVESKYVGEHHIQLALERQGLNCKPML